MTTRNFKFEDSYEGSMCLEPQSPQSVCVFLFIDLMVNMTSIQEDNSKMDASDEDLCPSQLRNEAKE